MEQNHFGNIEIGKRLKTIRIDHGMTAKALAETLGVTAALISNIENGKRAFSEELKTRVNSIHRVNMDWLITGKGPKYLTLESSPQTDLFEAKIAMLERKINRTNSWLNDKFGFEGEKL